MPKLLFSSWVSWGILACQTVMWCLLVLFVVWLFLVLDWASFGRGFFKMNVWYWVLALVAKGSALGFRGGTFVRVFYRSLRPYRRVIVFVMGF
jgi:hypothetical protein